MKSQNSIARFGRFAPRRSGKKLGTTFYSATCPKCNQAVKECLRRV